MEGIDASAVSIEPIGTPLPLPFKLLAPLLLVLVHLLQVQLV